MEKIGYRQILSQKDYCKIIIANMINRFGDSIDAIAYTWLVYAITGSAAWSAIIYAFNTLPSILLQPFTGAAVERRSKKKTMVVCDFLRGGIVIALAAAYIKGMVNPWILAVFTLTTSSVEAFCLPASTAIIPLVLEEKYYDYGISLNATLVTVLQLVGTAVAGIIIGTCGVEVAIVIDAITFFGSACMKLSMKVKEERYSCPDVSPVEQYFKDLKEGFSYMKSRQILINFCILAFLVNAMLVPMDSLQAPLVSDVLGEGSGLLSAIGTASVLGMGIGSLVFPHISKKVRIGTALAVYGAGLAISGILLPLGGFVKGNTMAVYAISIVAMLGSGFFVSLLNMAAQVQFLKCVDQDYLARAQALLCAGVMEAMPITSFLLGIVVKYVSVRDIMILGNILSGLLFVGSRIANVKFEEENGEKEDRILQSN